MQLIHHKTLDAGRRVQGFLDIYAARIGSLVDGNFRQRFDDAVAQLAAFQLEQEATTDTARSATTNLTTLRHDLWRRYLRPMKRIAGLVLRDAKEYQSFLVPAKVVRQGDFVASATTSAAAAVGYEKVFIENGMPGDFLSQLQAGIAQLQTATDSRARTLGRRSAATAGLDDMKEAVREMVKTLDDGLTPVLEADPAILADWKASKRIHQTLGYASPAAKADGNKEETLEVKPDQAAA